MPTDTGGQATPGRYAVIGAGAVGARAARQIHSLGPVGDLMIVSPRRDRVTEVVEAIGPPVRAATWEEVLAAGPDAVVLATGPGQPELAAAALGAGAHVVSTSEDPEEIDSLLGLDARARAGSSGGSAEGPAGGFRGDRTLVVGAAFAPGLSCVLALHAARTLDSIMEVRVATTGAAGPACARAYLESLAGTAREWSAGQWTERPAGGGREQCWFPDPLGARDCYRAATGIPTLLHRAFPGAERLSSRRAATRRDRLAGRFPPLGRPAKEGLFGAIRVEVVGRREGAVVDRVLGAVDRPGVAAGAVAALAARWAVEGRLARAGAGGLGELVPDTVAFLGQLAERGVKAAVFAGADVG